MMVKKKTKLLVLPLMLMLIGLCFNSGFLCEELEYFFEDETETTTPEATTPEATQPGATQGPDATQEPDATPKSCSIVLDRDWGLYGESIVVKGRGFGGGEMVSFYLKVSDGQTISFGSSAVADSNGNFETTLTVLDKVAKGEGSVMARGETTWCTAEAYFYVCCPWQE